MYAMWFLQTASLVDSIGLIDEKKPGNFGSVGTPSAADEIGGGQYDKNGSWFV